MPIVSLLKRATGSSELPESNIRQEELLQAHLILTQKWLVYWIVYASYSAVETVLLLKQAVPFYSFLKTILFAWMVAPIFMSRQSDDLVSQASLTRDWLEFSENGCGYCYYYYLKPWLEGEVDFLSKWDFNQIIDNALGNFKGVKPYVSYYLGQASPGSKDAGASDPSVGSNISSLTSKLYDHGSFILVNQFFGNRAEQPSTSSTDSATSKDASLKPSLSSETGEDFDFVDRPKQEEVINRKNSDKVEGKKGWIW